MKTYLHIFLKVIFTLILLFPVLGAMGIFPPPTRDLYNTDIAYTFINLLMETKYINIMMAAVHVVAIIALWTKREALATLFVTPIVANIVGFHAFLDGGLFTGGAVLADIFLLLTIYFLWHNREQYKVLLQKASAPQT